MEISLAVPGYDQRYMGVALEPLCSNLIIDADRIEVALDDCCARQLVPPNRWRQTSARSSRMDGVSFGPSELTMRSTVFTIWWRQPFDLAVIAWKCQSSKWCARKTVARTHLAEVQSARQRTLVVVLDLPTIAM